MSDNPYDEKNVRTQDFGVHAKIQPYVQDVRQMCLTLSVSDGPEAYAAFDPDKLNADGENGLTEAIATATNNMIQAALEQEAGHWIEDHETVYLVQGRTGKATDDPSRLVRWNVKAFLSEDRAYDLMKTLNHWCMTHELSRIAYECPLKRLIIDPEGKVVHCPLDPGFRIDEAGVLYTIVEVPLDMFDPIGGA